MVWTLFAALFFSTPAFAAGNLAFPETKFDFGGIGPLGQKEHVFSYRNAGEMDVTVTSVVPSCGCTAAVTGRNPLKPGESGDIKVLLDPAGLSGRHESTVHVTADDGSETTLTIAAMINLGPEKKPAGPPPSIRISPETVNLGKMKVGETRFYKVVIGNAGPGDLFVNNLAGRDQTGLFLAAKPIKKGKKVEITFFFKPDKPGKIKESVPIVSNDPKRPEAAVRLKGFAEK